MKESTKFLEDIMAIGAGLLFLAMAPMFIIVLMIRWTIDFFKFERQNGAKIASKGTIVDTTTAANAVNDTNINQADEKQ